MRYSTVLFDLDNTLFDAHTSELAAYDHAMAIAGVGEPRRYLDRYLRINGALWAAVERQELTPNDVRTTRFEHLVAELGLDADPGLLADAFVAGLGANGDLYPGARNTLDALQTEVTMALVTNGLGEVQRARIERLGIGGYFAAIVISGEVGVAKPGTAIYDLTFDALGNPSKHATLMVGDSLSSDMRGGIGYGIATCWYNPEGAPLAANVALDHEITALAQLPDLLRTGSVQ